MATFEQTRDSLERARAALEAETSEVFQVSQCLHENLVKAVKRLWRQLLCIWIVVLVLTISYLTVLHYAPGATNLAHKEYPAQLNSREETETAMLPQPSLPPVPAIPESGNLFKLLNQIQDAQYKKDIHLLLQAYAPTFPDLRQKRELTVNIWRRYDYLDLQFQLNDVQQKNATTISGIVTWNIKTRDRKNDEIKTLSKAYQVNFSKESGRWLVQKLKAVDNRETKNQE
jgi:hypothetical protein